MTQNKLSLGQAIDQIITALEGIDPDARKTAVDAACAHVKVQAYQPAPAASVDKHTVPTQVTSTPSASGTGSESRHTPAIDIRTLKEQKQPRSAREMACVVAYYLQELAPEGEQKESIATADLEKYFKQAQFKLPTDIKQVLKDAKGSGYFDSSARGIYKLNAVGYNLVAHKLPAGQAST